MITDQHVHILRHALGESSQEYELGFRNYFCAAGDSITLCEELVELGLMSRGDEVGACRYYFATKTGKAICGVTAEGDTYRLKPRRGRR